MKVIKYLKNDSTFKAGEPSDEDFNTIKGFMTDGDNYSPSDLFVYRVVLCDNNVDRDFEQFSTTALKSLASLFIGKTGIEDHCASTKNQHSRVYKTELVEDDKTSNNQGETYQYLLAYCYMLNNGVNKSIIDDIRSGIKKEVSVGFDAPECVCSLCGEKLPCWGEDENGHVKGREYDSKLCYGLFEDCLDAYEFSFVAIPAQPLAGVTKSKHNFKGGKTMDGKEILLNVSKIKDIDAELLAGIKSFVENANNPTKEVADLKAENVKLKKSLDDKNKEISKMKKEMDDGALESALAGMMDELKPVNGEAEKIARSLVGDTVKVADGTVSGVDEAKDMLTKPEYGFLFNGKEDPDKEDPDKEDESGEQDEDANEQEDESDDNDDGKEGSDSNEDNKPKPVKSKNNDKSTKPAKSSKSISFTKTANKSVSKSLDTGDSMCGLKFTRASH